MTGAAFDASRVSSGEISCSVRFGEMRHRVGWVAAGLSCLVVAGCADAGSTPHATRVDGALTTSAASCAALTVAQQFKAARVVFDGTMLSGPTVLLGKVRMLSSPAQVRVIRYLKAHGPKTVRVDTAAALAGSGVAVSEDGIEPHAGQRWRIYSNRSRQPFTTSICAGSRLLRPRSESVRRFTGNGVSFAYPSAWHANSYTVPSNFSTSIVDLGPKKLYPPCITRHGTHNTTITCREPIARLQPGSLLGSWSINAMPSWSFKDVQGTPLRIGRRPAKLDITHNSCGITADEAMDAVIAIPGSANSWYEFNACIRGPHISSNEHQVRDLLRTVRFTP